HDGFVKAVFPPLRNVAFLILYASRPREQCVRAHRAQFGSVATRRRFPSPQLVAVKPDALTS
ncbi:MAG: hypothetical protein P4N24_20595, partial [Acidobacteriota bacterium]|nr:hypothetical protein [Acidobacteriota bacterium]